MMINNYIEMMANFDWKNKTILIAEDDNFSFIYLREILSGTGLKIIYAENGMRAFAECLKNADISLVLMDIKMPVVNGLESTRLIKKYKPHIKIIAQTAFAMSDDRIKCLNAGCDDYITKPVIAEELLEKMAIYLNDDLNSGNFDRNISVERAGGMS